MEIDLVGYRPSFNIAILSADASLSHRFMSVMAVEGYTVKTFSNLSQLEAAGQDFPPHLLLIDYRVLNLEREVLSRINQKFPETYCYILGMIDDLDRVVVQLKNFKGIIPQGKITGRVVSALMDDAIRNLLLKYEVEKGPEKSEYLQTQGLENEEAHIVDVMDSTGSVHDELLERFNEWLTRLTSIQHYDESIKLFVHEFLDYFDCRAVIYFKYLPAYASLVATHSEGIPFQKIRGMGLNFSENRNFNSTKDLPKLSQHKSFMSMITKVTGEKKVAISVLNLEQNIKGMFVFAGASPSVLEDSFFQACHSVLRKWLSEIQWREKVYSLERHDDLTGCLNKKTFADHVFLEISRARRIKLPVSYVYISIDHIQKIKNELNSDRYKTLLKMVARVLEQSIRKTDFVGRMSENEFAILFPHMDMANLKVKSTRLKRLLETARYFNDLKKDFELSVTVSISEYPGTSYDAEDLMLSASQKVVSEENTAQIFTINKGESFVPDFKPNQGG